MAEKKQKASSTKAQEEKKAARKREEHPYETESQIQNRYGKGREHTGSDGGRVGGRGSNH